MTTPTNQIQPNKRVQGTRHKVSGPLTRDVGAEDEMDTISRQKRSWIMAQVKSCGNLSTEARPMTVLRENGLTGWRRYPLVGKPDFVFPRARVAVFVDGCFWHGHPTKCRMPKANRDYWEQNIAMNAGRNRLVTRQLREKGWKVVRIWDDVVQKPTTIRRLRKVLT